MFEHIGATWSQHEILLVLSAKDVHSWSDLGTLTWLREARQPFYRVYEIAQAGWVESSSPCCCKPSSLSYLSNLPLLQNYQWLQRGIKSTTSVQEFWFASIFDSFAWLPWPLPSLMAWLKAGKRKDRCARGSCCNDTLSSGSHSSPANIDISDISCVWMGSLTRKSNQRCLQETVSMLTGRHASRTGTNQINRDSGQRVRNNRFFSWSQLTDMLQVNRMLTLAGVPATEDRIHLDAWGIKKMWNYISRTSKRSRACRAKFCQTIWLERWCQTCDTVAWSWDRAKMCRHTLVLSLISIQLPCSSLVMTSLLWVRMFQPMRQLPGRWCNRDGKLQN